MSYFLVGAGVVGLVGYFFYRRYYSHQLAPPPHKLSHHSPQKQTNVHYLHHLSVDTPSKVIRTYGPREESTMGGSGMSSSVEEESPATEIAVVDEEKSSAKEIAMDNDKVGEISSPAEKESPSKEIAMDNDKVGEIFSPAKEESPSKEIAMVDDNAGEISSSVEEEFPVKEIAMEDDNAGEITLSAEEESSSKEIATDDNGASEESKRGGGDAISSPIVDFPVVTTKDTTPHDMGDESNGGVPVCSPQVMKIAADGVNEDSKKGGVVPPLDDTPIKVIVVHDGGGDYESKESVLPMTGDKLKCTENGDDYVMVDNVDDSRIDIRQTVSDD